MQGEALAEELDTMDMEVQGAGSASAVMDVQVDSAHGGSMVEHLGQVEVPKEKTSGGGRVAYYKLFPELIDTATAFLKLKGWGAQEKRRHEVCDSCGVNLNDLPKHLMSEVPGLQQFVTAQAVVRQVPLEKAVERVISKHAVSNLFVPPRQGTAAAKRHHAVIPAKVSTYYPWPSPEPHP